ncbi:hypothetical protein ALC56_00780 [Trachymyrmex septentrionalis]|uniref:Uncharacterized protein n=1 Tax=Trachymyrmex septentrionalis TaxID=34720 RepID=A0A195FVV9_9HYME|nr:hypothetical protein ALC56_00780 [Trachymyrmex septentrionalis]
MDLMARILNGSLTRAVTVISGRSLDGLRGQRPTVKENQTEENTKEEHKAKAKGGKSGKYPEMYRVNRAITLMKPLSINAGGDLRRNLSMRVYRIACAFANCIHTRVSHRSSSVIVAESPSLFRVYLMWIAPARATVAWDSSLLDGRGQFETSLATPGEGSNLADRPKLSELYLRNLKSILSNNSNHHLFQKYFKHFPSSEASKVSSLIRMTDTFVHTIIYVMS